MFTLSRDDFLEDARSRSGSLSSLKEAIDGPVLSFARKMRQSYNVHKDIRREGIERRSRYMNVNDVGNSSADDVLSGAAPARTGSFQSGGESANSWEDLLSDKNELFDFML